RPSAGNGNGIEFLEKPALRESYAGINIVSVGTEKYFFIIGSKIVGIVVGGIISKPFGFSAFCRYDEYIEISKPVAGKSNPFTVSAPYGHEVVSFVNGKGICISS